MRVHTAILCMLWWPGVLCHVASGAVPQASPTDSATARVQPASPQKPSAPRAAVQEKTSAREVTLFFPGIGAIRFPLTTGLGRVPAAGHGPVSFSVNGPVDALMEGLPVPGTPIFLPPWAPPPIPPGGGPYPLIRTPIMLSAQGLPTVRIGDVFDYLGFGGFGLSSDAEIFQSEPDLGPAGGPAGTNNQILVSIALGLTYSMDYMSNVNAYTFGEDYFNGTETPQWGDPNWDSVWDEPWENRDMYPGFAEPVVAPGGQPIRFYFSIDPWAIGLALTAVQSEATLAGSLTLPAGPAGSADVGAGPGPWTSGGEAAGDVFYADPSTTPGMNIQDHDDTTMALLGSLIAAGHAEDDLDALEHVGTNSLGGAIGESGNTHDRVVATTGFNGGTHPPDLGDPGNPNHDPTGANPIIFSVNRLSSGAPGSAVTAQVLSATDGASGDLFIAVTVPVGSPFAGMTTNLLLIDEGQLGLMPYDDLDAVILKLNLDLALGDLPTRINSALTGFAPDAPSGSQGYGFTIPLLGPGEAAVGFSVDVSSIGLLFSAVDFECRVDGAALPDPSGVVVGSGIMEQAGDIFYSDLSPWPGQAAGDAGTGLLFGQNYLWFEETTIGLDPGTWTFVAPPGPSGNLADMPDELNALDSLLGPVCGNGICDPGEDPCNCPQDCGNPPAAEIVNQTCADGIDNDCDGFIDCADHPDCDTDPSCNPCGNGVCDPGEDPCNCPQDCGAPPAAEVANQTCADGIDNDCDGFIDCADHPDCDNDPSCLKCGNGACDPGEDPCNCPQDCGAPPAAEIANQTCADGIDNDCDGFIDCADHPDCDTDPSCSGCGDGTCDPATEDPCNCPQDCGAPPAAEVANQTCADGLDNDCDGFIDCADHPDCDNDPACCLSRGACCLPNGTCQVLFYDDCVNQGGFPQGPNTSCVSGLCHLLKWAQPPMHNSADPCGCFWGWDEPSIYGIGPWIVADDWVCDSANPLADIHWWGSYVGWNPTPPAPPQFAPDFFHIGIWTDVPSSVADPFSHPGTMIRQWIVPRADLNESPVGCDQYPFGAVPDACFQYDFQIPQGEWFNQGPACNIYWISIAAMYSGDAGPNPWGWKTREHYFNDDAVRIIDPVAPAVGTDYLTGMPIEDPPGTSWDMAFVLTTKPNIIVIGDPIPSTQYPHACLKNRYISFIPNPANAGILHGYQVTHVATGQSWYISTPRTDGATPGSVAGMGLTYLVSDPTPPLYDFATEPIIHVGGCMIAPGDSSTSPLGQAYEVRATDGVNFSGPITVYTAAMPTNGRWWSDVCGYYAASGDPTTTPPTPANSWTPPDGIMNGFDVTAVVKGFAGVSAPQLSWTDINGEIPDRVSNGNDVLRAVNAFSAGTGREYYPYNVPDPPGDQGQGDCPSPMLHHDLSP